MSFSPPFTPLGPKIVSRTPVDPRTIRLVFGGDFAPADAAISEIRNSGYQYPYIRTRDLFQGADVAFANLEAPVTRASQPVWLWKQYIYRVDPAAVEAWKWLGLDIVSLANNHVLDYRQNGLVDTVDALDRAGIEHVGGGKDAAAARRPAIFAVGETRIGFLGYLENQAGFCLYEGLFAADHEPGCAKLTTENVADDVRRLRKDVDILIVSVHWGENYSGITLGQRDYARVLLDLGVDAVVGHHPHNEQAFQVAHRRIVFYSLGNYAWGAPGHDELRIGLVARLSIRPRESGHTSYISAVEVFPIVTQNRFVHFQPRRLGRDEVGWLDPFLLASQALGGRCSVVYDSEGPWVRVDMGDD